MVNKKLALLPWHVLLNIIIGLSLFTAMLTTPGNALAYLSHEQVSSQAQMDIELPNLAFVTPEGWRGPVVLSQMAGTNSSGALFSGEQDYASWAITSLTTGFSGSFSTCLFLDGVQVNCWETQKIGSNEIISVQNWALPVLTQPGSHLVEVVIDVYDQVAESNESDNRWSYDFTWLPGLTVEALSSGELPIGDARFVPPVILSDQSASGTSAPGYYNTSEYMLGSVAVGVIMPESSGSTENWTDTEIAQVKTEIQAGLSRWAGWANNKVSFTYEWKERIATSYEPITLSSSQESLWTSQALTNIGFPVKPSCIYGSAYSYLCQATEYVNDLRVRKGTDWAFVIFVVDSSADIDGKFSDGFFAYSYVGGPFMIMTYDNSSWGIDNMEWVTAHETVHTFLGADQYTGACSSTTELFGYLGVANSYCQVANPPGAPSPRLMKDGWGAPDVTTLGQVGLRDSNGDGLFDPVDTQPVISLAAYSPDPVGQTSLSFSGKVYDNPWPASTCCVDRDITINKIVAVQFRVDGGTWQNASPGDGAFDSDYENFSFTTPAMPAGTRTISVRAQNSAGVYSTIWSDTVTISAPLGYSKATPANDATGQATTVIIGWEASNLAVSYDYCVDTIDNNTCDTAWYSNGASRTKSISNLMNNTTYYWQVRAVNPVGATNANSNTWWRFTTAGVPENDTIEKAKVATKPYLDVNEVVNATKSPSDLQIDACDLLPGLRTVWYKFSAPKAGTIFIDTLGSNYDTYIAVWSGTPSALTPVACNDDDENRGVIQSSLKLDAQANVTYYIEVGEWNGFIEPTATLLSKQIVQSQGANSLQFHITTFNDVPGNFWAWKFIEGIASAGVTSGCGSSNYCPRNIVGRDQMAVFLLRAKYLKLGTPIQLEPPTGMFSDVPVTYWAAAWIEQFAKEGITGGCGNNNYCPTAAVTREQMAIFLLKAKYGPAYTPPPAQGIFADVPITSWTAPWIEQLTKEGITSGCGNNNYCPKNTVTRDQMAVFLSRTFGLAPLP